MTRKVESPITSMCIFLWIGFVLAISFMEAWLKFQAPGITLALGRNRQISFWSIKQSRNCTRFNHINKHCPTKYKAGEDK